MASTLPADLKNVRTFPSLVAYLRDELDWPIGRADFEDLTFDYSAEELGIDSANAAKIQEIKRLRPLSPSQPWGIFFVKFEPKRLPVVALRRILSSVALKKRASANSAERTAWAADDLLFISNFGDGQERQISFAHFSSHGGQLALPVLKVLGWDNLDTRLHLDHVAVLLHQHLAWPEDEGDADAWRDAWGSAFTLRYREVITTSKLLAERLAGLARGIRDRIQTGLSIETEEGPLTKLMISFREALVHDLDADGFADMYAQTIAYGLMSARVADPTASTASDFAGHMQTNPFLRELMESFLSVGGSSRNSRRAAGIDFDELGIKEVIDLLDDANMEAVIRDFGDRNPQEDPVIHFYELFLKEYDAKKRMQRGVFYTPRPVVSYIVRSIHALLRERYGLADGLADTATWGEVAEKVRGLQIPAGIGPADRFVSVLDPATGTGTFLVETIDVIHTTLVEKWRDEGHSAADIRRLWNEYVPRDLLPRLHGYELLMAPYAIAHLKIGLKLHETGYEFAGEERARIYLTNALEPARDFSDQLAFAIPALAHEAQAVNAVKTNGRFTVVVGNPPYSLLSANLEEHHRALVDPYKLINGERIREKAALQLEKNLNDDYVKFVRLAQMTLDASGTGVSGLITNHSFIDNPTMRGVRWNLLQRASELWVLDLHGNSTKQERPPEGVVDANVFQIKQGVAITLRAALPDENAAAVHYHELWGPTGTKESWLAKSSALAHDWTRAEPGPDMFLFIPQAGELAEEFKGGFSLPDLMPVNGAGYITARDNLVVGFDKDSVTERVQRFSDSTLSDTELLREFDVAAKKGWDPARARTALRNVRVESRVIATNYRPFDERWIFFDASLVWGRSWPTLRHVAGNSGNLTLLATRMTKDQWEVWVARTVSSHKAMSAYDTNSVFPLNLVEDAEAVQGSWISDDRPNLSGTFLAALSTALETEPSCDGGLPRDVTPEHVFAYIYAVFQSPTYRRRYQDFLVREFPRLPLPNGKAFFRDLVELGERLIALHLLEGVNPDDGGVGFIGPRAPEVGRVAWSDDTVWIDAPPGRGAQVVRSGSVGFRGVSEQVWTTRVGGYQVCQKWLKDRKGRPLSSYEIARYRCILVALRETYPLRQAIDGTINEYGGWPDAFVATSDL